MKNKNQKNIFPKCLQDSILLNIAELIVNTGNTLHYMIAHKERVVSRQPGTSEGGAEEHRQVLTRQKRMWPGGVQTGWCWVTICWSFSPLHLHLPMRAPHSTSLSPKLAVSQSHAHKPVSVSVSSIRHLFSVRLSLHLWENTSSSSAEKKSTQSLPPELWLTCSRTHTTRFQKPQSRRSHAPNITLTTEQTASCILGNIHSESESACVSSIEYSIKSS